MILDAALRRWLLDAAVFAAGLAAAQWIGPAAERGLLALALPRPKRAALPSCSRSFR